MKNWISYSLLANKTHAISFNTDIFETNLINIAIFSVFLFYFLKDLLKNNLSLRHEQIINSIQASEKQLSEANNRLAEAHSKWSQAQIIIEEIKSQTKRSKENLLKSEFNQINDNLCQRFNTLLVTLYYREQQVLTNIQKQVSELVLKQVISKLQTPLIEKDQAIIINNKIQRLGSHL
jgi:F-type H+-transporting ATPase subunit b